MAELKEKIHNLITTPALAAFATLTHDGRPWVRFVMIVADEDLTVRFATYVESRKVAQIAENPNVHLTAGNRNLSEMGPYLQMEGTAELTTSEEERKHFWSPELSRYFKGPDDPNYGIIRVRPSRIEYYTPPVMEPEVLEL
jgi:general stress protein 26